MRTIHQEVHRTERVGWLRAAVLGAIVSTASLVLGLATAEASRSAAWHYFPLSGAASRMK